MADWTSGTCPRHANCAFFISVGQSPVTRIKYATMFPFCKGGRHESCMRWFLEEQNRPVPDDLLPDGGTDVALAQGGRNVEGVKSRVLVVDDMPLFRKSLAVLVSAACNGTCDVVEVSSGEEALSVLSEDPNGWLLVATDFNMGAMSGYDLIVRMRSNPALSGIPVVIFSSETDGDIIGRCQVMPRVRWLEKKPDQEPFTVVWTDLVVAGKT